MAGALLFSSRLDDPVAWSAAHGGVASAAEAMKRKAAAG